MTTNQVSFKRLEVSGATKAEAHAQAPFQIFKDATTAWRNAGKPIGDKALKEFCANYLQKHTKFAKNVGCSITLESAVSDTRTRPYKILDIKNEKGRRAYKTGYQGINKETGEILFTVFGNKSVAKDKARELYTERGFKGSIVCKYIKEVVEGEVLAFEVTYAPSISSQNGKYFVFGVEND